MSKHTGYDKKELARVTMAALQDMAGVVKSTLGPAGRTVIIELPNGHPLVTKDGVTVARHYGSGTSHVQDVIARVVREACERTGNEVGDGTTTAIVLTEAIVRLGQEFLQANPSYSPEKLSRDLTSAYKDFLLVMQNTNFATQVKDKKIEDANALIKFVAMVSANHDEAIADAVVQAVEQVGLDGMLRAEEGVGHSTSVTMEKGFPVRTGFREIGGPAEVAFLNNQSRGECILEESLIALYDGDITDSAQLIPIMTALTSLYQGTGSPPPPVVFVAHSFTPPVLRYMAEAFRKHFYVVPYVTHMHMQQHGKQLFLHDLAAYVGGKIFEPHGTRLEQAKPEDLGGADRVVIGQNNAAFFVETPDPARLQARVDDLKAQLATENEHAKSQIRFRIGQLSGGIAVILAGGATSAEAKERQARLVDAISAVRAAIDSGIVPGGGATFLWLAQQIRNLYAPEAPMLPHHQILFEALRVPFRQVLQNAGFDADSIEQTVLEKTAKSGVQHVFNVLTEQVGPWNEVGIADPAKVITSALGNALSVAKTLITLGGFIVRRNAEEEERTRAMSEGLIRAINYQEQGGDLA